jgi:hypothetical protein
MPFGTAPLETPRRAAQEIPHSIVHGASLVAVLSVTHSDDSLCYDTEKKMMIMYVRITSPIA